MDPEQTFIRVQDRFSQILTPRLRAALEYIYLFTAITLFCILVVMHANYVQQPGCASEFSEVETADSQIICIKITSAGLWFQNETGFNEIDAPYTKTLPDARRGRFFLKIWNIYNEPLEYQAETSPGSHNSNPVVKEGVGKASEDPHYSFVLSAKETLRAAVFHFGRKWHRRLSFIWRHVVQIAGSFCKLWDIAAVYVNLDVPKWSNILHLDRLNSYAVQFLEKRSKAFEPTYLYTMEKGYFLLSEASKSRHNIHTINISISAWHPCFGNRWQQLIINRFVGYDTILMNSLLNSPGKGYLYNYQTKEFYNLSYVQEPPEGPAKFADYVVTKCGVLMMSLFVFFTTTMSVSFTLRETQTRMLKFTVQLQHHASHQLPTFQLIFVHVIESLVFVPIMIGILFFLFEFYDDQLLAFMVLILVWLCELFTFISVRTPISMKFFPRFFLLYFLVFHIYFFSYAYGFSYLALSTTAAFMQHLILYFWNRFEVPALQRFMQNGRSQLQRHPDFHITSSTFLASMFHITRLNTRSSAPGNPDSRPGPNQAAQPGGPQAGSGTGGQVDGDDHDHVQQAEAGADPGALNSVSSLLLWILGGASTDVLNSIFSIFRDVRDQAQAFPGPRRPENNVGENVQ